MLPLLLPLFKLEMGIWDYHWNVLFACGSKMVVTASPKACCQHIEVTGGWVCFVTYSCTLGSIPRVVHLRA